MLGKKAGVKKMSGFKSLGIHRQSTITTMGVKEPGRSPHDVIKRVVICDLSRGTHGGSVLSALATRILGSLDAGTPNYTSLSVLLSRSGSRRART